jgi:hypothetical protein
MWLLQHSGKAMLYSLRVALVKPLRVTPTRPALFPPMPL